MTSHHHDQTPDPMSVTDMIQYCADHQGGTFYVDLGSIRRPAKTASQDGRPMGVQPWSYSADNANPTGTKMSLAQVNDAYRAMMADEALVNFTPMDFESGYMVSVKRPVPECPESPAMDYEYRVSELTDSAVYAYTVYHQDDFAAGLYLGVWHDDGIWYLDCSAHVPDLAQALRMAEYSGQLAVWDCARCRNVPVTKPETPAETPTATYTVPKGTPVPLMWQP